MGAGTSTDLIKTLQVPITVLSTVIPDPANMYPSQTTLQHDTCYLTQCRGCPNSEFQAGTCDPSNTTSLCESIGGKEECGLSSYDYIVVGAGTAGCVIATRLAEDGKNNILVLEAGPDPPITALFAETFPFQLKSEFDYNYQSTFDEVVGSSHSNYFTLNAGKMLGGTDSLNFFYMNRGCPLDYDGWANITGDDSWTYEKFLPYFIKSERVDDDEIIQAYPQYRGTNGPIGIIRQKDMDMGKLQDYFNAFEELGHPTVLDQNANEFSGYALGQYALAGGIRQITAILYMNKVKDNANFNLSKNTTVTRVLFENNIAVAVEAVYQNSKYILRANKEIILCAGVFNTPQILMLSGIGHAEHLAEMNIEVIADLPVGDGLTDHTGTTLLYKTKEYDLPSTNPLGLSPDITKIPFAFSTGLIALDQSQKCADYMAYVLVLTHDTPQFTLICKTSFWYRNDICDRWQNQIQGREGFYAGILNATPKSRGTVRLNSADPFDPPVITTNYLSNDDDLEKLLKDVKNFLQVSNTTFFQETNAELVGLDLPECADQILGTDEFWRCYIMNTVFTIFHYTGTCPMGCVVDSNLKLLDFERIRLVDASVFPELPQSGPAATVIALAEKAFDIIASEPYY